MDSAALFPHAAACVLALLALPCSGQPAWERQFVVRLDGEPVGTHRFAFAPDGADGWSVTSQARFEVKLFGWTAYRYRHEARERWKGDCLALLEASTDDDGRVREVRARHSPGGLWVEASDTPATTLPDTCAMTFAYWNPRLAAQRRLLDPATGRMVAVQVDALPPALVDSDQGSVRAQGWRIAGLPNPIDVWWAADRWVGLDTLVRGRRLTYRLR